jgi:hypothetical protein
MFVHFLSHYPEAVFWIGWLTAACYIAASVLLYYKRKGDIGVFIWGVQLAIYWTAISVYRSFFGYIGPSTMVSLIGAILYLEFPIIIIADQLLKRRYKIE